MKDRLYRKAVLMQNTLIERATTLSWSDKNNPETKDYEQTRLILVNTSRLEKYIPEFV
jgi:hypothetical protein